MDYQAILWAEEASWEQGEVECSYPTEKPTAQLTTRRIIDQYNCVYDETDYNNCGCFFNL